MSSIIVSVFSAYIGLYVAIKFVPGVEFLSGSYYSFLIAGALLGLANFFLKPPLKAITLPIRIITLGIFSLVIDLFLVWIIIDVLFPNDFEIHGVLALIEATFTIWIFGWIFNKIKHAFLKKRD